MEQIQVTCQQNGRTLIADVLSANENVLRVAVKGTNFVLELHRQGKVFEGRAAGLTFESDGIVIK